MQLMGSASCMVQLCLLDCVLPFLGLSFQDFQGPLFSLLVPISLTGEGSAVSLLLRLEQ